MRIALLGAIFALVAWGFAANNQRQLDGIRQREALKDKTPAPHNITRLHDPANLLTPAQQRELEEFLNYFTARYGLAVSVYIADPAASEAGPQPGELLIFLDPEREKADLRAGNVFAKALGPEFIAELAQTHFPPYFQEKRWADGLAAALSKIEAHFK